MALLSKLYLHRAASSVVTPLPATNVDISTATPTFTPGATNSVVNTPLLTNLVMDQNISGVAQTSLAYTTDNVTTNQQQPLLRWASPILNNGVQFNGIQFTVSLGYSASSTVSVFGWSFTVALWRPYTSTVGILYTGVGSQTTAAAGTSQASSTLLGTSGMLLSTLGDVLILEVWRSHSVQTMGTSYTNTLFYDGTTESSATNIAAFLSFSSPIDFISEAKPSRPSAPSDPYGQLIYAEPNLKHYWRLSETSHPWLMDTEGTSDLLTQRPGNTMVLGTTTTAALGNAGVQFPTQQSDYISTPEVISDFNTTSFSIEFWVLETAVSFVNAIYVASQQNYQASNFLGWYIRCTGSGTFSCYAGNGSAYIAKAGPAFSYNVWHHIVMSCVAGELYLYFDGAQYGSPAIVTPSPYLGHSNFTIDGPGNAAYGPAMKIDEVAFYSPRLDPFSVNPHYRAGKWKPIQGSTSASGVATGSATASKLSMPSTALAGPVDLFN